MGSILQETNEIMYRATECDLDSSQVCPTRNEARSYLLRWEYCGVRLEDCFEDWSCLVLR